MRWSKKSLCLVLPVVVACGSSSTAEAPKPVEPPVADAGPTDAPAAPAQEIAWGACPARFRDQCAKIRVPLDHAHPEGEQIEVFLSRRGTGTKQLWLLQGGPGGSADVFFNLHDFLAKLDPDLEVYTLEHRGVGESTRLGCAAEKSSSPSGSQIAIDEWAGCRDEVVAKWGPRLSFFSSTQAAHDLDVAITRTARPGQRVFVYGGSYGTYWAHRFALLHPERANGLILDAPVQPGAKLHRYDLQFEPVGRKVFSELCPQAPRCAEHLGADPLAFLDRVVAALKAGHCSSLGVDMDSWRVIFGVFLMDYNLRNWLPAVIHRLDRCSDADQTAIATLLGNLFKGGGGVPRKSDVTQVHILLSEFWPKGHADDAEILAARPKATFFQNAVAHSYAMQDTWPRYEVERASEYARPELPILTLAGALDPAAPPAAVGYGYRDNLKGPHQVFVEIPYGAHTVLTTGAVAADQPGCPAQLVAAFLKDPKGALPTDCAAKVLKPSMDATKDLANRYFGTDSIY